MRLPEGLPLLADRARHSWERVQRPAGARLAVAAVREDGTLTALVPMVVFRSGPLRLLRPLGDGAADECAVVGPADQRLPARLRTLWHAVTSAGGYDLASLLVPAGEPLHRLLVGHAGARCVDRDVVPVARLSQEPDWETYASTLGRLSGRKPGAALRKLEREAEVRRRVVEAADEDVEALVDWTLEQKRDWAGRLEGSAGPWLEDPRYRDFLIASLRAGPGDRAPLTAFVVEADGRVVAVSIVGVGRASCLNLIGAFDQEWAGSRVGTIAWEYVMQWCLERSMDFDFGYGGFRYKRYFSKGRHHAVERVWLPRTAAGRLAVATLPRVRALRSAWSPEPPDKGATGAPAWAAYAEGRGKPR